MTKFRVLFLVTILAVSSFAVFHEASKRAVANQESATSSERAQLEKELWDVEQQWLCSSGAGPYHKEYKDCVQFRGKYWADQFFEISAKGPVQTKAEMIAVQTAAAATHTPGVGPYPRDFKLMAVYGNVALATDQTDFKTVDATGKLAFTSQTRVLRIFVKEDGTWRPAGAAIVPIVSH
jgi:hypothetical protein